MPKTTNSPGDAAGLDTFLAEVSLDASLLGLLENLSGSLCFVKDRAGRIIYNTARWAHRHGFEDVSELMGKTDEQLTPGEMARSYTSDDEEIYRTGQPLVGKVELCVDELGLPGWHRTTKFPLRNREGKIVGIFGFSREDVTQSRLHSSSSGLAPALELLRSDLRAYPPAEKLAELCHLSVRQMQRRFTVSLGVSPREYWMKSRIRMACESIRTGEEKLASLAERLGFCDQSSFTAQFRRHTGVTPREYRKRYVVRMTD